jgi:hypothetical protein
MVTTMTTATETGRPETRFARVALAAASIALLTSFGSESEIAGAALWGAFVACLALAGSLFGHALLHEQ